MKIIQRYGKPAFTLIELLACIVIIVMLAAMVLGGLKYAQDKQASEKTRVELARLGSGIEEYKLDKGIYPPTGDSADGTGNSNVLFKQLYWDSNEDGTGADTDTAQKIYVKELDPANKKLAWLDGTNASDYRIVDAWTNEVRYRSELNESGAANASTVNPGYDLWSPGKDGSTTSDANSPANRDDIKNP